MATGRKKRILHTRERQHRANMSHVITASITVVSCIFMGVLIWYGTRLSAVSVERIDVTGAETVSRERIEERVNALLVGGHVFGLIPYRFSYAVPSDYISSVINEMPRIAGTNVSMQGASLVVAVTEHIPETLWCGAASTSDCFYVDPQGVAYEKAPDLSGEALVRFVVQDTEPKLNESLLSDAVRATLLEIARAMEERHKFRVSKIVYSADGDASLWLSGGGVIQVATAHDLEITYANLASILTSAEFAHLSPGNFERIDLRFGNKAFVQEEPYVAATTASTTSEVE